MRALVLCLVVALGACDEAVGLDEKHVTPPEQPFDSVAWDCTPGDSVVNGQVAWRCGP